MVMNFLGKSKKGGGHGNGETQHAKEDHGKEHPDATDEEMQKMIDEYQDEVDEEGL